MKTNTSSAPRNSDGNDSTHPPLARDSRDNMVAVPDGTAAWCLKRETGGRPRMIVGPDREPTRFPLDVTIADLEAMVGAGTYRVYALSQVGEVIDYVTTIVVGASEEDDEDATAPVGGGPRSVGSDLRHALDTIREMTRAQAESLRAVAASQADFVKGLAVAKALPRNAVQYVPMPPARAEEDDDEDEEEDDDGGDPQPPTSPGGLPPWMGAVKESVDNVAGAVKGVVELKKAQAVAEAMSAPPRNAAPARAKVNPMTHLAQINTRLNRIERTYLSHVLRSHGADDVTEELLGLSVDDAVAMIKESVAKAEAGRERARVDEERAFDSSATPEVPTQQDFMARVGEVSALLTAEERAAVMWLFPKLSAERVDRLKRQLLGMTAAEAAEWVRANLATLQAEVSS